jgi:hypothetical protein
MPAAAAAWRWLRRSTRRAAWASRLLLLVCSPAAAASLRSVRALSSRILTFLTLPVWLGGRLAGGLQEARGCNHIWEQVLHVQESSSPRGGMGPSAAGGDAGCVGGLPAAHCDAALLPPAWLGYADCMQCRGSAAAPAASAAVESHAAPVRAAWLAPVQMRRMGRGGRVAIRLMTMIT